MPRQDTEGSDRRCEACGARNYPFASFCISCGEPLETGEEPQFLREGPISPGTQRAEGRSHSGETPQLTGLGRRETIIGVALLLLAVGFALYQWHHTDEQNTAYRQGLAAEMSKDWNKAAEAFSRAGDHPGAQARAQDATGKVEQRNRLYQAGVDAQDRGDWKTAVASFEGVLNLQPSYQDSARRLEIARREGSMLELGGLVFRVNKPPNEGLFYMDGLGHTIQLPGSDRYSSLRAISRPGTRLVYDRSRSYAFARAMGGYLPMMQESAGREVAIATIGLGQISDQILPGLDPSGSGTFAASGLWWKSSVSGKDDIRYVDTLSGSPDSIEVQGSLSMGSVIAYDPPRSRLIWGTFANDRTVLTITDAQGKMPWLAGTVDGAVESASVSRDGRWLLVVARQDKPAGTRERAVWVQSLEVSWDPKFGEVLGKPQKLSAVEASEGSIEHISATFLPSDARPVRVAVDAIRGGLESMTIYSLDTQGANQVWYDTPALPESEDSAGFSNSAGLLASPRRYSDGALLELFDLASADFRRWFNVPLSLGSDSTAQAMLAPRKNYIVATVQNYRGMDGHESQYVYTAHVATNGSLSPAKLLATTPLNGSPTVAPAPGGSLLAYVNRWGDLRVVNYDGTNDSPVAHSVNAVWALGKDNDLAWSR